MMPDYHAEDRGAEREEEHRGPILGRMRYEAEFTPMISRASICSVMRIVPISDAMFDPTLPGEDQRYDRRRELERHGFARGIADQISGNERRLEAYGHLQGDGGADEYRYYGR